MQHPALVSVANVLKRQPRVSAGHRPDSADSGSSAGTRARSNRGSGSTRMDSQGNSFNAKLGSHSTVARSRLSFAGNADPASSVSRADSLRLTNVQTESAHRKGQMSFGVLTNSTFPLGVISSSSSSSVKGPLSVATGLDKQRPEASAMEGQVSEGGGSTETGSPAAQSRQPYHRLDSGSPILPAWHPSGLPRSPFKPSYLQQAPQLQRTVSLNCHRQVSLPGSPTGGCAGGEVARASPDAAANTIYPATSRLREHGSPLNQKPGPLRLAVGEAALAATKQLKQQQTGDHLPTIFNSTSSNYTAYHRTRFAQGCCWPAASQ